MKFLFLICILFSQTLIYAQDSSVNFEKKIVTLKELVVRNKLDVNEFIKRVKDDTTFHKAFLNLKMLDGSLTAGAPSLSAGTVFHGKDALR